MRIINLIENTEGRPGCAYEHGLSFYIETEHHRLLMDLGPSEKSLKNAENMGIDLSKVDTMILSHGHYDHSGGIVPFLQAGSNAVIYMQETALGEFYGDDGEEQGRHLYRYIGVDKEIAKYPCVKFIKGDFVIDEELEIFTIKKRTHELPSANKRILVKKDGSYVRDTFEHEQYLVISCAGKKTLMSGCAHNGVLSILDEYRKKYGKDPDIMISGFHLMKKTDYNAGECSEIMNIADELKKLPVKFYTCHCTGMPAYLMMKEILDEQLEYVHSGEEIISGCRTIEDQTGKRRDERID